MNWRQIIGDALTRLWNSIRKRYLPDIPGDGDGDKPGDDVIWHDDAGVGSWPVTAKLAASLQGGILHLRYDKASAWPIGRTKASDGGPLVGNCWVIAPISGRRQAATFDWMRHGQQWKAKSAVTSSGGHIAQPAFRGWQPKVGEQYGFVVTTFARGPERTLNERSDISMVTWR